MLFGVGDDGVEARVAVKRLEIRVTLDAKVQAGRYTVIDGFAQEWERLIALPLVRCNASEVIGRHGGLHVVRAEGTALNLSELLP